MADHRKGDTASWDAEQVRRSQSERRPRQTRRRRRRRLFNPLTYLLFVVVVSALLAGVGWLLASDLCAFNKEYVEATVEVTAEDNMSTIAQKLEDAGLIVSYWGSESIGARRKYYRITQAGCRAYDEMRAQWRKTKTIIDALLGETT